jgi:hypothetical protein
LSAQTGHCAIAGARVDDADERRVPERARCGGRAPGSFASAPVLRQGLRRLGTAFLQLGYQKGGALTVAGLATLLTNALPIAAGTVVLGEVVPSGVFGGVRVVAFAAVTLGAILLARPDRGSAQIEATTASVQTSGPVRTK